MLASDETQHALRQVASSPEIRDAMRKQTTGLAEEVVGGVRASAVRLDGRVEHAVSRGKQVGRPAFAGIATRALALATDAIVTTAMFMAVVGVVAIVASLVGGLGPDWLVGTLLSVGWNAHRRHVLRALLEHRRTHARDAAACVFASRRMAGGIPSVGRSIVRLAGLVLSIASLFIGFVPVLFDRRRRGLADFLGGTVVLYDDATIGACPVRSGRKSVRGARPKAKLGLTWVTSRLPRSIQAH